MVEVILRDDITKYKPKFLFGLTARQAIVYAIVFIVVAAEAYLLYFKMHLPLDMAGLVIVGSAAAIVVIGLRQRDGIYMTALLVPSIKYSQRATCTEHLQPELVIRTDIKPAYLQETEDNDLSCSEPKAHKQERKRDLREAKQETEFCSEEGICIKPSVAAQKRNIVCAPKKKSPLKKDQENPASKQKKHKKKGKKNQK